MRVMTYNIHSGRDMYGKLDLDGIIAVMEAQAPDILGVNEVRRRTADIGDMDQAALLAQRMDMHMAYAEAMPYQGGSYGIMLLSRYPITSHEVIRIPDAPQGERGNHFEPRVVLRCQVQAPQGALCVLVTHAGLSQGEQRQAVATLAAQLAPGMPTMLLGDLNMTPDDETLAPIWQLARGNALLPLTFPADAPEGRIDYIITTPDIKAGPLRAISTLASDHLPLVAEIALN